MGGVRSSPAAFSAGPGVGTPRSAGPGEGLLGRAGPDDVREPPHGGGHLAGGGALLDRSWAGPVRPGGSWRVGRDSRAGRAWREPGSLRGCSAGRYLAPVVASSLEQLENPELDRESLRSDVQTRRRRLQLRLATTRMRAAALGRDMELEDWGESPGFPESLSKLQAFSARVWARPLLSEPLLSPPPPVSTQLLILSLL